ncbi:MAG: sigma-70 family RNA polymerase sigma factor [Myxococcales bacterium]|nr:MAG: sigma-70 family RNA polymerase sigma factor [Myxococcales bacterium]
MQNTGHEEQTPAASPRTEGDAELVTAIRRGDREAAAGLLIATHAPALGRTCMALLGSQAEAEDALQETLGEALEGSSDLLGEGSLRGWLYRIARRRCAARVERRGRQRAAEAASAPADSLTGAEQVALARRARALLSEVRPTEREALVLRFEAELSFREVGEACGIDEAAARKRVSRGLSRLRGSSSEDDS